jgi:hypothetical protein
MGANRTLLRKQSADAIARVRAGIKTKPPREKRASNPRAASTYRGARRNECLKTKPKSTWGPDWYYEGKP